MSKKTRLALFVYTLICNIPVCFCLCFAAAITGSTKIETGILMIDFNNFNWLNVLYNFLVGMTIAELVGNFLPLPAIGRWFTSLFHIKNDTYTGNMPYRLLATLIITIIYYLAITPSLTLFNYFVLRIYDSPQQCGIMFLINVPIMLLVGFVSSLINDVLAYRVARKIDGEFGDLPQNNE